jgi:hypothetical protein
MRSTYDNWEVQSQWRCAEKGWGVRSVEWYSKTTIQTERCWSILKSSNPRPRRVHREQYWAQNNLEEGQSSQRGSRTADTSRGVSKNQQSGVKIMYRVWMWAEEHQWWLRRAEWSGVVPERVDEAALHCEMDECSGSQSNIYPREAQDVRWYSSWENITNASTQLEYSDMVLWTAVAASTIVCRAKAWQCWAVEGWCPKLLLLNINWCSINSAMANWVNREFVSSQTFERYASSKWCSLSSLWSSIFEAESGW